MDKFTGNEIKKILIYRSGSLGDTIVALPALKYISRKYPDADRYLLTPAYMDGATTIPLDAVLRGTGYVSGYLSYPAESNQLHKLKSIGKTLQQFAPDLFVYLAEPVNRITSLKNYLGLKLMGAGRVIGTPLTQDRITNRQDPHTGLYEHESLRLLKNIMHNGDVLRPEYFDKLLNLAETEYRQAEQYLEHWPGKANYLVVAPGSKVPVKDWGFDNWKNLLSKLADEYQGLGIVFIGSDTEYKQSEQLGCHWQGPVMNLCGKLKPRASAALMSRATLFLGHDGGAMHLAAVTGIPCVAVFSSRSLPGVWFPMGNGHQVIYHEIECQGCLLHECIDRGKACINSISVNEVLAAVKKIASFSGK